MSEKAKAEKLIMRGSETPEVAQAARDISEFLVRMYLGQAQYAAHIVERMIPKMTADEARNASKFFLRLSRYFLERSHGEKCPHLGYQDDSIRNWHDAENYVYKLHKVFCVLACDLDYCADNPDCWETRSAFCKMDERSVRERQALTEG